jgi:hypothetical protein
MHADEFDMDANLVRRLLRAARPAYFVHEIPANPVSFGLTRASAAWTYGAPP